VRIQDKVVVITGGASGLGLAAARELAQRGARIAILDRDETAGERACGELGSRVFFAVADVAEQASVRQALDAVVHRFGTLHVAIQCAALLGPGKLLGADGKAASLASFECVLRVNLTGTWNVMAQTAERMARNEPEAGEERGVVVNVASIAAHQGQIGQCGYAASKAGVIGLALPAARELAVHGIRVNTIAPGLFLTPMAAQLEAGTLDRLMKQPESPMRLGDPREFAHCCAFVIENRYLNAETIHLDAATRLPAR
jgi:NAD(P)-dependent dehydrogenase (short-subunit alcohol dehydrogenase family)